MIWLRTEVAAAATPNGFGAGVWIPQNGYSKIEDLGDTCKVTLQSGEIVLAKMHIDRIKDQIRSYLNGINDLKLYSVIEKCAGNIRDKYEVEILDTGFNSVDVAWTNSQFVTAYAFIMLVTMYPSSRSALKENSPAWGFSESLGWWKHHAEKWGRSVGLSSYVSGNAFLAACEMRPDNCKIVKTDNALNLYDQFNVITTHKRKQDFDYILKIAEAKDEALSHLKIIFK